VPTVTGETEVPIFDNWAGLSFKRAMGNRSTPGGSWMAPRWVGDHVRRLTAYMILQAYFDNAARYFLHSDAGADASNHREYGDAETLRDTIMAALLGDDQTIVTAGADRDPEAEDTPTDDRADIEAAIALQEWLRGWGNDLERLGLKMIETERNAVGLGDGVYVLGWSNEKNRVRLRVFDPGHYFPVLSDGNEDDFPERVHIAWEIDQPDASKRMVRRITWELVDLTDERVGGGIEAGTRPVAYADDPATQTCLMTDATWTLDLNKNAGPDDFTGATAAYETYVGPDGELLPWRDMDLGIDFIPVVHMPNTVAISNHYGKSSLTRVLQILDDIANSDTDLQAASGTTGKPPVAISNSTGTGAVRPTWRAGDLWQLGPDGRATMVDTSKSLDALIKYVEHLMKRLDVSSRVPGAALGRIDHADITSGVHLSLSFGPLKSMVQEMRLVRDEKYPLLLKFVWRMSLVAGLEGTPTEWIPSRIEFGNYLPQDTAAMVEMVVTLLKEKAIGRRTAIRLLVAAGLDLDDAEAEVESIESTDFEGAVQIADATGSEEAAADYLGIAVAPPVPPEAPPIPPPVIEPPTPAPEA
jgi:hypothetical protein